MASEFPSIAPSRRTLRLAEPPTKLYKSLSGSVVVRSFGDKLSNYVLDLNYQSMTEADLNKIWDHYHDITNLNDGFSIPKILFSGYGFGREEGFQGFAERVLERTDITWYYAEPPSVESVSTSFSNVTVKLAGNLRYSS